MCLTYRWVTPIIFGVIHRRKRVFGTPTFWSFRVPAFPVQALTILQKGVSLMFSQRQMLVLAFALVLVAMAGTLPHQAAPAPPLSELQVTKIRSQRSPVWENVSTSQLLTNVDHSGSWLEVETREIGYSNPPLNIARFSGVRMTQISSTPIVGPDRVIRGWLRVWRYSSSQTFTSGRFTYEATSINFPFNKMSDWIQVK